NLYDFLLNGTMPLIQLADGDVIFVGQRTNTVRVTGLAENAKRFEFTNARAVADLVRLARPRAAATHVRVVRNTGPVRNTEYYTLAEANRVVLQDGDELEFTSDKKLGTITVRVEGEHLSAQEYVLPYGTRLGALLENIQYSERSDVESLQLFRLSVKERQRAMLQTSLRSLEAAALTARSGTSDEARLRAEEADLILQWVARARSIESTGQVVIAQTERRADLLLENGDVVRVPTRDGLVLVSGEVLFPNAIAYDPALTLDDYVKKAGGYTQNADSARLVVARRDGSFAEARGEKGLFRLSEALPAVRPGDEVLVLPKIDVKSRQIWKDITQIVYQIAISAKVVLGL
ncbi:MAG TPA: SLBB domain-containing protein, partial [Ramlibacter sp.]